MKKIITFIVLIFVLGLIFFVVSDKESGSGTENSSSDSVGRPASQLDDQSGQSQTGQPEAEQGEAVKIMVTDLEVPWDIAFLPGGDLLITERPGRLVRISQKIGWAGELIEARVTIPVPGVKANSEGGLLGIALHPDFSKNSFLYLYFGTAGQNGQTRNQVVRYEFKENILQNPKTIIENIPGAIYHDGGRIDFGPDGMLYVTTGDATESALAQNLNSLAGKILRLRDDGTIPADNPFGTAVYSYGHRNPQGLAWDAGGKLWSTEHGRSGVLSGLDELNFIEPGKNYGWPEIQGDEKREGMISPVLHSGSLATWAPASLVFLDGKLYFGGLKGEALYEVSVNGREVSGLKKHFSKEFGRIRTVRLGPDGFLYLTTSNRDGRGKVQLSDDKIIRINAKM